MPKQHEDRRNMASCLRGSLVRNDLLPGRRGNESASREDQTPTGRGCDAATPDGRAGGMAQAIGEMIAVSATWIDTEDGMRGV